ncbi:MAG TPA: Rieske 2Fe-2S domain-containing protein [Chloroflexota bacterium]|nr:Rieske 2Fe-2S domain-containing protein [Chloroflexota bacterium]
MNEDHLDFTRTGPGTLAGKYLRRFWQPVSRARDLAPGQARPIQVMSEKFTLYRGEEGAPHLVDFRCAHRGTQLSTGWVEGDCIRCLYHGWKYDGSGQCVEQPGEDAGFAPKIKIRSYPVREYLGLLFAYLGEGEPPELRRFPDFERPFYFEVGSVESWPCNYFNRMENDPAHVPWVHRESLIRNGRQERLAVRSVAAEETEYGVRAGSSVPGKPVEYVHYHMPNSTQTRSRARVEGSRADAATLWADRLFFHVPIDDESNHTYVLDLIHLTGAEAEAYAERRRQAQPAEAAVLNDMAEQVLAGKTRIKDMDQDLSAYKLFWVEDYSSLVGQGAIPNREADHLGRGDAHVILVRNIWRRELAALREGMPLKEWRTPAGLADMSLVVAGA